MTDLEKELEELEIELQDRTKKGIIDEETSGALQLAINIQKGEWPHTMDAQVWAKKFKEIFPESDEEIMLGWFANAIMAGHDIALLRINNEKGE